MRKELDSLFNDSEFMPDMYMGGIKAQPYWEARLSGKNVGIVLTTGESGGEYPAALERALESRSSLLETRDFLLKPSETNWKGSLNKMNRAARESKLTYQGIMHFHYERRNRSWTIDKKEDAGVLDRLKWRFQLVNLSEFIDLK